MKLKNKKSGVLWLTGLSGAGKSTIGDRLSEILQKKGTVTQRLDGNLLKGCFGTKLNFKGDNHDLNIRLAAFVGSALEKHGVFVIASFISPYKHQRELVRDASTNFIEVYVEASLDICTKRDVKGFYKKIISGERNNFPGFSYPYEIPENPNLVVNTENSDIELSVKKILDYLLKEKYI
ncbi:adenylyl-sulfate kinase [Candidatus Nomurabacteria bacterium RIFCSPLOWO2_01_FULL_40_18]|uniref:Adenylyl-sulfate kinase n=1 Tax=Candidatus Nomurabacteria bacterium RIFCSPLOWO2_01_FULL_40_18 TaxID=1801773 RepID=A0A1F6XL30_9BACT|nr:MAG: adenylyl-sulfate kinase [Candidatus Nomurabacteria bacterium RIFCSPLOWO2_01_FULL_40_18]